MSSTPVGAHCGIRSLSYLSAILLAAAALTCGCAVNGTASTAASTAATTSTSISKSSESPVPTASTTTADGQSGPWSPAGMAAPIDGRAAMAGSDTIDLAVGQRIAFDPPAGLIYGLTPDNLSDVTFYGDYLTLIALKTGVVKLSIFNAPTHFDCPNGPCAHPNQPIELTLRITAGGKAPKIPAAVNVSALKADTTLTLHPGQQVIVPAELLVAGPGGSQAVVQVPLSGGRTSLVATRPGSTGYDIGVQQSPDTPAHLLTLTVTA